MDNLEKQLTKLKTIEPNGIYKERSRAIILGSQQVPYIGVLQRLADIIGSRTLAVSAGALSIALIIGALSILGNRLMGPSLASNFDKENINKEVEEFNFQFAQVEYYENSAKKIEVALKKTSGEPLSAEELSL